MGNKASKKTEEPQSPHFTYQNHVKILKYVVSFWTRTFEKRELIIPPELVDMMLKYFHYDNIFDFFNPKNIIAQGPFIKLC